MSLFAILLVMHGIGLIVCGLALRYNLPPAIHCAIRKNSKRWDGSFSRRRNQIEQASLNHAFRRLFGGLAFIFVVTFLAGFVTKGARIPIPNIGADSGIIDEQLLADPPNETQFRDLQWPVALVYLISSVFFAPPLISQLYQSALNHYFARANLRFMDYYRQESLKSFQANRPTGVLTND